jgi:hypothetical protein
MGGGGVSGRFSSGGAISFIVEGESGGGRVSFLVGEIPMGRGTEEILRIVP